jgi:hypothetical protein
LPKELIVELRRAGMTDIEDLVFGGPAAIAGRIDDWS